MNYILPRIRYTKDFKKLNDNPILCADVDYIKDIESILSLHRACIVAEPGYGKTRLLSEIYDLSITQGKNCAIIDLKKLDKRIEQFLQDDNHLNSKNSFEVKGLKKSDKFVLNNSNDVVVCLDALDEVKNTKFSEIVKWILEFSKHYDNIKLVVSCRTTFIINKYSSFEEASFYFLSIEKFSENEIKQYFKQNNIKDEISNKILNLLHSNNDICIKVPRYLTKTVELLQSEKIDISNLTRGDL